MTQATPLPPSGTDHNSWEPVTGHDGVVRAVVEMQTRDGVTLVADVYAAGSDSGPRPVLLERTPYGRRKSRPSDAVLDGEHPATPEQVAARLVARGFVVVRQDCRGKGDSSGVFTKYVHEAEDGYDTVTWAAGQPWSDGRVATMGVSYSAHAQTALAALHPGALVAMFIDSGGFASAYEAGVRMGGAFELKQATWALRQAATDVRDGDGLARRAVADEPVDEWFRQLPWRRGHSPLRHVPAYEDYFFDQWEHEDFGPYWTQPALFARGHAHRFPDVPSLHLCSWYDPYVRTAIENFHTLTRLGSHPVRLVMGPWTHGRRSDTFAGDVDFGAEATLEGNIAPDYVAMRADWFSARLAGLPDDTAAVRYFLMGGGSGDVDGAGRVRHGGRWRTAATWPPETTGRRTFHLHPHGGLAEPAPPPGCSISWDHDPADPVPTIGGQVTSGEPVMSAGAFDQTPGPRTFTLRPTTLPLAARPDVLVFQTDPLEAPLMVAGPVVARLTISSTAVDTDLTVKVVDVHPPTPHHPAGFAMNVTEGILRCRFRDGFDAPAPMTPGESYEVEVVAPDTANVFDVGHRLRIDVASSSFPRFDVNPGTGEPVAGARRSVVATNTLHLGPSHIDLWVERPSDPPVTTTSPGHHDEEHHHDH